MRYKNIKKVDTKKIVMTFTKLNFISPLKIKVDNKIYSAVIKVVTFWINSVLQKKLSFNDYFADKRINVEVIGER